MRASRLILTNQFQQPLPSKAAKQFGSEWYRVHYNLDNLTESNLIPKYISVSWMSSLQKDEKLFYGLNVRFIMKDIMKTKI